MQYNSSCRLAFPDTHISWIQEVAPAFDKHRIQNVLEANGSNPLVTECRSAAIAYMKVGEEAGDRGSEEEKDGGKRPCFPNHLHVHPDTSKRSSSHVS
ncbi:hypothetical protein DPEC_G00121910 [Dallia pectoralis]|uniref:Uncharacterized protein n=1 Tax=Dallia pectoralis TaxID=75939 RepID=A0ACC2GQV5_DALPE|nr:hypothetical protein DPEC_G00121910 [Dallia pectoralis]